MILKRNIVTITYLAFLCQISYSQNWLPLNKGIYCDSSGGDAPFVRSMYADQEENKLYLSGNFISDGTMDNCITETSVAAVWNGSQLANMNGGSMRCFAPGGEVTKYNGYIYESAPLYSTANTINCFARWNETQWDSLPGAPNSLAFTSKVIDNELWLGGAFSKCGDVDSPMLCKYDGVNFYSVNIGEISNPNFASSLEIYKDTLYVGGQFYNFDNANPTNTLAKYYNNKLNIIIPTFDLYSSGINTDCIVSYKNYLYVGGFLRFSGQDTIHYLLKYDGIKFSRVGPDSLQLNQKVVAMKEYKNELYILGQFDKLGGQEAHNLVKWDGEKYTILNTDTFFNKIGQIYNIGLQTFDILNDTLYVGGNFFRIGQDTMRNIAKLNRALSDPIPPPAENSLNLYPNPSSNEVSIGYTLNSQQNVSFSIYDIRGRRIKKIEKGNKTPGKYVLDKVNVSQLAAGIYFVSMQTDKERLVKKLVKE